MGTSNKARRRAKKAERSRQRRQRTAPWEQWERLGNASSHRLLAAELVEAATHAECTGRSDGPALVERLVGAAADLGGRTAVAQVLRLHLQFAAAQLQAAHWSPADLAEIVRRRATVAASRLTLASPTFVAPDSPAWPSDVRAAIAALSVLEHLTPLTDLSNVGGARSPSAAADTRASSDLLGKIRGLLAKAESTDFPEEADALTAKATELMTRYRIDRSMVDAEASSEATLTARRIWVDEPYVEAKRILLGVIARSSRCEAIGEGFGSSVLVGHPDDLDLVELLFTSLLVQATRQISLIGAESREAQAAARTRSRQLADEIASGKALGAAETRRLLGDISASLGGERRRSPRFRRSFLIAYASRVGTRLEEAAATATQAAAEELGTSWLPVLARQQDAVERAIKQLFGEIVFTRVNAPDREGWAAGVAAADLADLGVRRPLEHAAG